jgi:competence ComEA-like helix-hairpin-helix protein
MKKLFPDKMLASTDTSIIKDKRTLVLFLLGLALLSLEFWPFNSVDVRCSYNVVLDKNRDRWRVVSLPAVKPFDKPEILKAFALQEESIVLPLIHEQVSSGEIPAALSLFINCPLPINRAEKEALEMLPGVGPHIANSILAVLQHQGKFASSEDLLKVSGIGPKSMQRLLPLISFE